MTNPLIRTFWFGRLGGLLTAVVALSLGTSANAGPIGFSPTGTGGGVVQVGTFDENPGNALAVGAQSSINAALASLAAAPPGSSATTASFAVYYQANVTLLNPSGQQIGTPGVAFTAVAKFFETATVFKDLSNTVVFTLSGNQTGGYLNYFAHSSGVGGNNVTGAGFANDTPGSTLIYSGALTPGAPSGNFTNSGGSVNLDSYPSTVETNSQQSVSGIGGSQLSATTTYVNTSYFVNGNPGTQAFTSTNSTPFTTVDPSLQFVNLTGGGAGSTFAGFVTPALGAINGSTTSGGPDFQFQADASSSFGPSTAVPEPASIVMTLLGVGGLGLGTVASRRRRASTL